VLKEGLAKLPEGVEKVYLRTDTQGYEASLLRFCAEGTQTGVGVIEFAIGVDVTPQFRNAVLEVAEEDWHELPPRVENKRPGPPQQWAEVCFVPNSLSTKKDGPEYRFIAIREPLVEQLTLPGVQDRQTELPFPTMIQRERTYKLFGLVTNRKLSGEEVIRWHRERCGKSEHAHAIMKHDLAGGTLPSGKFGENAAWWAVMILAFNLNALMRRQVLRDGFVSKRMKAIRYWVINIPARVHWHARQLWVTLSHGHPSLELLMDARNRIRELARLPAG
jgi:hypothetical protein